MKGLLACLLCVHWMPRGEARPQLPDTSRGAEEGEGSYGGTASAGGTPFIPPPPATSRPGSGNGYSAGLGPMEVVDSTGGMDILAEEPNYRFQYEVKDPESGNDFGHMEARMGNTVTGSYHVLLPDGRIQRVDYVADQDGYKPMISYEGEAKYGPGVGVGNPMIEDIAMENSIGGYSY